MPRAVGPQGQGSVSIKLQLVRPVRAFWQSAGREEQHRLDEGDRHSAFYPMLSGALISG